MSSPLELVDLRVDIWGNRYNSAGARFRNTEKMLDIIQHLAFPKFESELWTSARVYQPFTFVHDSNGDSYVSTQSVPSGIDISNESYWTRWEIKDALIRAIKADLEVQKQRVNNAIALKEGSTTGDAELADIRVGLDSKIYDSAGDAVREQLQSIKDSKVTLPVDSDGKVAHGDPGQFLLTLGDGTTAWGTVAREHDSIRLLDNVTSDAYDLKIEEGKLIVERVV